MEKEFNHTQKADVKFVGSTKEFNLSEKMSAGRNIMGQSLEDVNPAFYKKDVKEFIKRLRQALADWKGADDKIIQDIITRLAGDKLI